MQILLKLNKFLRQKTINIPDDSLNYYFKTHKLSTTQELDHVGLSPRQVTLRELRHIQMTLHFHFIRICCTKASCTIISNHDSFSILLMISLSPSSLINC